MKQLLWLHTYCLVKMTKPERMGLLGGGVGAFGLTSCGLGQPVSQAQGFLIYGSSRSDSC